MWLGWSAARPSSGRSSSAGLLDRYLARAGWDSADDERRWTRPERPDNLDGPLPGDRGAHGDFDARAKPASVELWARLNAGKLAAGTAAAAALALVALRGLRA